MTRYNNPLPHNQVPPSQGRPAGSGQPPQQAPEHAAWPGQQRAPLPAAGYADPYPADPKAAAQHDPYAALRPDGYGYAQPSPSPAVSDPYGLAGYTAPQPLAQGGYQQAPVPLQPSYDPYAAPSFGTPAAHGFGAPASPAPPQSSPFGGGYATPPADQWGAPGLALDPRDYAGQGYADTGFGGHQSQWGGADPYGAPHGNPALGGPAPYQGGPPTQHGSFDQSYAEDDAQYDDEPYRSPWKKVAVLVTCTVFIGGVLTFGYSSIMGTGGGPMPLIKGAAGPSKVKPSEPGGKQFPHTDSKILGRLGEGGGSSASDPAGVRKVPVVTVGRDGSIQPPGTDETRAVVAVPGLTVIDGLGGAGGPLPTRPAGLGASPESPPVKTVAASDAEQPTVVEPPAKKKAPSASASEADADAVPTKAVETPKQEKVAKADPTPPPAATGPKPTGAGYVAVLASVPASNSSRIDALKQFADMQQKYGTILSNKTPDIQEADLGAKGTYHRLLVGPPGSRDSASSVCTQLKAEGYSGCWVTAY